MLILIGSGLYICDLIVAVYSAYCTMLDRFEKPALYLRPHLYCAFVIGKVMLFLSTYFVLYRAGGIYVSLSAGGLRFVLYAVLLRRFYNKRVAIWRSVFIDDVRKQQASVTNPLSETEIEKLAMKLAHGAATRAMKNER